MIRVIAAFAAASVLGLIGGTAAYIYLNQGSGEFAQCRSGTVGGGDIGGAFTLLDKAGTQITDKELLSKPALVYFGYTFCPDVCPLDNIRNAEATDILEELGFDVTPVFITIDPERDTPEVMGDYTDNMHPRMVGLSGSAEQIKTAAQAYKAYYSKQPGQAEDLYLMDHSTFTYLMLPETGFAEFFRREDTADQMAEKVACFLQNS